MQHKYTTEEARIQGRRGGLVSGHKQREELGKMCEGDSRLSERAMALLARGHSIGIVLAVLKSSDNR